MLRYAPLLIAALTCLLAGCSNVSVDEPFGEPIEPSEKEKLIGVWRYEKHQFEVRKNEQGNLIAGMMSWNNDTQRFAVSNIDLILTQLADYRFMLMRAVDEPQNSKGWTFVRCEHAGEDELKFYTANVNTFSTAVKSGELDGTIKQHERRVDIKVTASVDDLKAFIKSRIDDCFSTKPIEGISLKLVR